MLYRPILRLRGHVLFNIYQPSSATGHNVSIKMHSDVSNLVYDDSIKLTLSSLNLPLSSHPLQAVNCCRNSRLVVDEDDLKSVKN